MWDLSYIITNLIHTKLKGQGSNHCLPPSWVGAPSKETWASCDHFQKLFHANIICSSAQCKLIYRCYFATEEQKTRVVFSEFGFQCAVIGIWCLANWSEFPPKYPFWTCGFFFFSQDNEKKMYWCFVLFFPFFSGNWIQWKSPSLKKYYSAEHHQLCWFLVVKPTFKASFLKQKTHYRNGRDHPMNFLYPSNFCMPNADHSQAAAVSNR